MYKRRPEITLRLKSVPKNNSKLIRFFFFFPSFSKKKKKKLIQIRDCLFIKNNAYNSIRYNIWVGWTLARRLWVSVWKYLSRGPQHLWQLTYRSFLIKQVFCMLLASNTKLQLIGPFKNARSLKSHHLSFIIETEKRSKLLGQLYADKMALHRNSWWKTNKNK